jgi:hypothetical protein
VCAARAFVIRPLQLFSINLTQQHLMAPFINSFFSLSKLSINRTDGRESPLTLEADDQNGSDKPRVKYGELVILGYVHARINN